MRVAIREQLALLVIFLVLAALCIVAVPTWIYVHDFVVSIENDNLALTASLKASRISAEVDLIQTSCFTISSRILLQNSLTEFYNTGATNWSAATADLESALSIGANTGLLQARLFPRNQTEAGQYGLLNVTGPGFPPIPLPFADQDGQPAFLGDSEFGYPRALYPNITYVDLDRPSRIRPNVPAVAAEAFPGVRISSDGGVLLGPLVLNESSALLSISVPVRANNDSFILGHMTIVAMASSLFGVRDSREGLGKTGTVLIVGPTESSNRFNPSNPASNQTYLPPRSEFAETPVHFLLPPTTPQGVNRRHSEYEYSASGTAASFPVREYPAAFESFSKRFDTVNNASSLLATRNEQDVKVSVGFARTQTPLVNWTVIVEKARDESYEPIDTLSTILLGTVFGTAAFVLLIIFPIAHLSVLPIARLKHATEKSVNPPGYDDSDFGSDFDEEELPGSGSTSRKSKKGLVKSMIRMVKRRPKKSPLDREPARRLFKIPGKVEDRKHFVTDELTELTRTFNDMSDELVKQYMSLDDKVAERTRELEDSKKAAEAANESKTLFIANISHELKTPLNGILGMCAVCMEEKDIVKIHQSLKMLYKSGDLLLHLLEDLLSFSKNQIGQQLKMEFKEFRLADIRSQILIIFDKQVREGKIDFNVNFIGNTDAMDLESSPERFSPETRLPALGPHGTGRLKDMCLWGDQHRVLQVIINLVSNSLKFTPPGGKVEVRIRCLRESEATHDDESRASSLSKTSRTGRPRHRGGSSSTHSAGSGGGRNSGSRFKGGTALAINPLDPKQGPHIQIRERSPTPPPASARTYLFEIEVEDTGPGIPEHMQQKVFEPFVQGDLGLSKKYGGTGLGLSICHQLAGLMGGSISLRSTVGVGTTFMMVLPLKYVKDRASSTASSSVNSRAPSADMTDAMDGQRTPTTSPKSADPNATTLNPQPRLVGLSLPYFASAPTAAKTTEDRLADLDKARANKQGPGKLRVLVADDNSTNIEVVSRMLKLEDIYDVTIAKDGQEAFEQVKKAMDRKESFDVIFMDVQMPNIDGLQSTRLIREMGYKSPIVALTALSDEGSQRRCIDSGMDEFLAKPIRRPALKQVLKKFSTILEEPGETAATTTTKVVRQQPPRTASPDDMSSQDEKTAMLTAKAESVAASTPMTTPETTPGSMDTTVTTGTAMSSINEDVGTSKATTPAEETLAPKFG